MHLDISTAISVLYLEKFTIEFISHITFWMECSVGLWWKFLFIFTYICDVRDTLVGKIDECKQRNGFWIDTNI